MYLDTASINCDTLMELISFVSFDSIETSGELKNGFVLVEFVGPKITATGVPNIFAKCMLPVSLPITREQEANSFASSHRVVPPAKFRTLLEDVFMQISEVISLS